MEKFDGVLLASDFDDTLFRSNITGPMEGGSQKPGQPIVDERNREALDYFMGQGGRFTVATGRVYQTFAPHAPKVPMNAPAVLANGAIVHDFQTDKELFHAHLPRTAVDHAYALAAAFPEIGFETHLNDLIYTYRPNEITWRHIHKLGFPHRECPFEEIPQPWTKLLLQHADHEALVTVQTWFSQHYGQLYETIFSNDRLLEITARGCHKGNGVLRVARELGVAPEHIYCVGDNQNDIPMLSVAAAGFAPANCAAAVRDWGATIVSPCDQGAIADVVALLDKRY